jgi:23S rRNA (adenine-N6)-dimethyltransferase
VSGSGQRRWGWHRIRPGWARRVVDAAAAPPGQLVLDLGSGTGALTAPLAERGLRVVAVELHPGRAERLRRELGGRHTVTVVQGDLLEVPLPRRPFRVVANPPYAVSAALVRRITGRGSRLVRADLVLPRWQAKRYVASPPRGYVARIGMHVPAAAFQPPPRDDSAVLVLSRR